MKIAIRRISLNSLGKLGCVLGIVLNHSASARYRFFQFGNAGAPYDRLINGVLRELVLPCRNLHSDVVKQRHADRVLLCPSVVNPSMPNTGITCATIGASSECSCCVPGEPGCLLVRSRECTEIGSGVKHVMADLYTQRAGKSSPVIGNMNGSAKAETHRRWVEGSLTQRYGPNVQCRRVGLTPRR